MAEYWDIYDANRQKTGRQQLRGAPMERDDYHLVVEIWLMNRKGEFLLTRRHPEKHYGGLWECTGGSVVAGEESLAGACREVLEEIGVDLMEGPEGRLVKTYRRTSKSARQYSAFYDIYFFERDIPLDALSLQADEVTDAKWVSQEEFEKMYARGEIVPKFKNPFELCLCEG